MLLLLLSILITMVIILFIHWFVKKRLSNTFRTLKWNSLAVLATTITFLSINGRPGLALTALIALLLPWFKTTLRLQMPTEVLRRAFTRSRFYRSTDDIKCKRDQKTHTLTIETAYLRMIFDHTSGHLSGQILLGSLSERVLEELSLFELIILYQLCSTSDRDSLRLFETWLDCEGPTGWRRQFHSITRGSQYTTNNHSSPHFYERGGCIFSDMTRIEALQLLDLDAGATPAQIRTAHHRLMDRLHPDHGGSNYLAIQINRARDVLLNL